MDKSFNRLLNLAEYRKGAGDLDDERFRPADAGPTEVDLAGEIAEALDCGFRFVLRR